MSTSRRDAIVSRLCIMVLRCARSLQHLCQSSLGVLSSVSPTVRSARDRRVESSNRFFRRSRLRYPLYGFTPDPLRARDPGVAATLDARGSAHGHGPGRGSGRRTANGNAPTRRARHRAATRDRRLRRSRRRPGGRRRSPPPRSRSQAHPAAYGGIRSPSRDETAMETALALTTRPPGRRALCPRA